MTREQAASLLGIPAERVRVNEASGWVFVKTGIYLDGITYRGNGDAPAR